MRPRAVALGGVVLALLFLAPLSTARATVEGTAMPLSHFGGMVVDDAHHLIFAYSDWDPFIAVLDDHGVLIQELAFEGDPSSVVIVGDELFVCNGPTISVFRTSSRPVQITRKFSLAPFNALDVTYAVGRLWWIGTQPFTSSFLMLSTGLDGSPIGKPVPLVGGDPTFVRGGLADDSTLAVLLHYPGSVGLGLFRLTDGRLSYQREVLDAGGLWIGGVDAAYLPAMYGVVLASDPPTNATGPPGFRDLRTDSGSLMETYRIPVPGHPNAVAVSSSPAGLIAGAALTDGKDDVWVYRMGDPEPAWSADLGSPDMMSLAGGLAWSEDGTSLFMVAGDPPNGVTPRLFILHPFAAPPPSVTSPAPEPTGQPPQAAAPPQARRGGSDHLGLEVILIGVFIGGAVGAILRLVVIPWRSRRKGVTTGTDRAVIRAERALGSVLEQGERVTATVQAVPATPDRSSARIFQVTLFVVIVVVATLFSQVSAATGVLTLLVGEVVVLAVARWAVKPREMVLTDRRLLVRDIRAASNPSSGLLSSMPLGPSLRANAEDGRFKTILSLSTADGTESYRIPSSVRARGLQIVETVELAAKAASPDPMPQGTRKRGIAEVMVRDVVVASTSGDRVAAAIIGLAGLLSVISFFLPWAHLTFPRDANSLTTARVGHGFIPIVTGGFLLLRAFLSLSNRALGVRKRLRRSTFISAGILGAYVLFYGFFEPRIAYSALAKNTARNLGLSVGHVQALINEQVAHGVTRFDVWVGFLVAMLAVICAIAGALAVRSADAGVPHPRERSYPVDRSSSSMLGSITPGWGAGSRVRGERGRP